MADQAAAAMEFVMSYGVTGMLLTAVLGLAIISKIRAVIFFNPKAPPHVPSPLPWLGNIVAFGEKPIDFLLGSYNKYGPVFSFTMFGTDVTYLLGSEASPVFFNSKNDDLNAEDLYKNITVPVFGKGVCFDVENKIFSQQKAMCKKGLTVARFAKYTAMVEHECKEYLKRWDDEGEVHLHEAMAEMIVFTATRCLHGAETRKQFTEDVAKLYDDLDGGFSPQAWFFPAWMPFPSFFKRDAAHAEIKKRFGTVIEERRKNMDGDHHDLLQTFLTSEYPKSVNDGRSLNEAEISGLLIALLMAGQHTSSTTSSWFGFYMSKNGYQDKLHAEQVAAMGDRTDPISVEDLEKMPLLHACVRETLRLKPPIMQMMRKVRKEFTVKAGGKEYVIPAGNQVAVSPSVNGRNPDEWPNADQFQPERFINEQGEVTKGEHLEDPDKPNAHKWVPFGAGRHRCIGFEFAQLQIRCVWSTMLRTFEFNLPDDGTPGGKFPETNYRTMIHTPLTDMMHYKRRVPKTA